MRRALRLIALTLALPVLYALASVVLPLIPGPGPDLSGPPARQIGLLQGPIHTDILFPLTPEVRETFTFAEPAGVPINHPDAQWLILGWGSAAFYTTAGTYADITAISRDLGYAPTTSIEAGVPAFVEWYRGYHGV